MKFKVGDEILVTAGKDKGRKGKIEKVFPKENRVFVPGVNIYKKTRKGAPGEKGGIVELPRALPVAKIALICPKCAKQTRISYRIDKRGEKTRVCAKCKREIYEKGEKK